MTAHVKIVTPASEAYDALDNVATDLSGIRQLADAVIRLTDDPAVSAVAEQIGELSRRAEGRRRDVAALVHPYAFASAA